MVASWKIAGGLLATAILLAAAWHFIPGPGAVSPSAAAEAPAASEPPPVDGSAPPPAGGPIEVAFVDAGTIDVSDELCGKSKRPPRQWLKEGATVWLYGPEGLGKGSVGRAEVGEDLMGVGVCTAQAPIEGIDGRKTFLIAAPQGHGLNLMKEHFHATTDADLVAWPAEVASEVRKIWVPEPGAYEKKYPIPVAKGDASYAMYASSTFTDNGSGAEAWKLDLPGTPLFYTAWRNLARTASDGQELQWFTESAQGWFRPAEKKIEKVGGECGEGTVRGIFDLNRDGKIELAMEVDAYEMPPFYYYCEWSGEKFVKVR